MKVYPPPAPAGRPTVVTVGAVAPDPCPQCGTVIVPVLLRRPDAPTGLAWVELAPGGGHGRLHGPTRCLATAGSST